MLHHVENHSNMPMVLGAFAVKYILEGLDGMASPQEGPQSFPDVFGKVRHISDGFFDGSFAVSCGGSHEPGGWGIPVWNFS